MCLASSPCIVVVTVIPSLPLVETVLITLFMGTFLHVVSRVIARIDHTVSENFWPIKCIVIRQSLFSVSELGNRDVTSDEELLI